MQYKFHRSLVGGTFDRFHLGHQKLLTTAFEQSEKVIIGIATGKLFKDKSFADLIESFDTRKNSVSKFLLQQGLNHRFEIVPIHDFYGTTLTDKNLDAIFITQSNRENVLKINHERQKKGFKLLEIIIVPYVFSNDHEIVSSERIRRGEIDREGNSYKNLFVSQKEFILPENEREELRQPIGTIEKDIKDVIAMLNPATLIIAVGDIVSQSLATSGRQADISIIDRKTRRHPIQKSLGVYLSHSWGVQVQIENPAGAITQTAVIALQEAIIDCEMTRKKQLLVVKGEEDLLAIPAILLSPLQSVVIYGQFDKGIVVVTVSEQNKKRVRDLFKKFQ